MIKIYDSLSKTTKKFVPQDENNVTMYACGPTVYADPHIGNIRAAVAADVVFRTLRLYYGEDNVKYSRNITDIDDKIIKVAKDQGVPIETITEHYTQSYNEQLDALNVLRPTTQPKALQHVHLMMDMIEELVDSGYAYVSNKHIYFDTTKTADMQSLMGPLMGELGGDYTRIDSGEISNKRNPSDFVLWKPSKDGEFGWEYNEELKNGRVGWHIECSAMIKYEFGDTVDIHMGGRDLKFPHHDNERAQSVAHNHANLANYWVHSGFVNMGDSKMSKSEGTVVLAKDLLKKWDGEVIRLALLKSHYRSDLIWSESLLEKSKYQLDRWYRNAKANPHLLDMTPVGIFNDFSLLQMMHGHIATAKAMGFLQKTHDEWFKGKDKTGIGDSFARDRHDARMLKDWQRADGIRTEARQQGFILEDGPTGTTWRLA